VVSSWPNRKVQRIANGIQNTALAFWMAFGQPSKNLPDTGYFQEFSGVIEILGKQACVEKQVSLDSVKRCTI
jgi:hypothetical protein